MHGYTEMLVTENSYLTSSTSQRKVQYIRNLQTRKMSFRHACLQDSHQSTSQITNRMIPDRNKT